MNDGDFGRFGGFDFVKDLLNTAGDRTGKPDFAALCTNEGGDIFDDYDAVF
jgi:hypothetical protein